MSDDNRLDLGADLDKVSSDFLKDVEAAAKEVKQRKAADKEKDRRIATRTKDRKMSAVVIAVVALLLVLTAYWLVFARAPQATTPVALPSTAANPKINSPAVTNTAPKAPQRPTNLDNGQRNEQQPYGDEAPGQ